MSKIIITNIEKPDFRYILKDDLRIITQKSGKRFGFDEKKLAKIRREKGFKCFFASNEEFRKNINLEN
jgi:hypothetical protein